MRYITLTRIEKSPHSWLRRPEKGSKLFFKVKERIPDKTEQLGRRKTHKGRTIRLAVWTKWLSLTCLGTINNHMHDSNLSITSYPMVSSAPYRGYRPVYWISVTSPQEMTWPWYWLAPNTIEGENREKNKRYNSDEH
jgi:hypothetical protein